MTKSYIVISDETVWGLYKDVLSDFLPKRSLWIPWVSPAGEQGKSFENYQRCVEHFLGHNIHRNTHLVALGGGAVSDLGGFVAATLLRGIPWSVIPTTLLSMVDASIGGKVGINSVHGKNLIGSFHLPQDIRLHLDFLKTLPPEELASGKGEILKYCFLSREINTLVKQRAELGAVINACASYKQKIVDADFLEQDRRKILNFGHSLGHVYEHHWHLPHGIAVALGIRSILKHFNPDLLGEFHTLTALLGLDTFIQNPRPGLASDACLKLLKKDKKTAIDQKLELILLDGIGEPRICATPLGQIETLLRTDPQL